MPAMSGPYDDPMTAGQEFVDVRDTTVAAWTGHGETRAGDAGHEAAWGSSSPSHEDDAAWIDSSAAY